MKGRRAALVVALAWLAACAPDIGLTVDLRTDLVPGSEFTGVQTEVSRAPFTSPAPTGIVVPSLVRAGAEYESGVRVAELPTLGGGDFYVRVSLVGPAGATVASRVAVVHLTMNYALTSVISRSCTGVVCPPAGGGPSLTACNAGHCVDPRCTPTSPEHCGTADCRIAADCATHGECALAVCVGGACLVAPDSALCPPPATCALDFHCVGAVLDAGAPPDAAPGDVGPTCPATETACTNGADDDCDGLADCADSDCAGVACDDHDLCTYGDACAAGTCAGTAISCASDACAARVCNGTATCTAAFVPDMTGCPDDGNPCTDDWCIGGTCVASPKPDNFQYGPTGNDRCCAGVATDISTSDANCGVCGNSCGGRGCSSALPYGPDCNCTTDTDCRGLCYDSTGCRSFDGRGLLCQCQTNADCLGGQQCCNYGLPGCRQICKWTC